jgi:transposase
MTRARYPSDLTDRPWPRSEPHLPLATPGGRPRRVDVREIVDAILSGLRNGISWRALPHDHPPWKTVYHYFRSWTQDGGWEAIHTALREEVRVAVGRAATPGAAILASPSVKTTAKGGRAATTRRSV